MKKIILALGATLMAQSAHAAAGSLASLNCLASNGVLIKSVPTTRGALKIETSWGLLKKDFTARVGVVGYEGSVSTIDLVGKEGTEYTIALRFDPTRSAEQKSSGTIYRPSLIPGTAPSPVAFVHCDVKFL